MRKNVLITGCSTGIGLTVAKGLADRGYNILATVRAEKDIAKIEKHGLASFKLDLADSDSIQQATEETLRQTGGSLYALINNGAYGQPGAVEDLTRSAIREQFEVNVFGTMELTNRIIPTMRKQKHGRIIQISSILGFVSAPFRGAYNASKYALEGLTDAMRLELDGSGVRVSLIEPGPITSDFRKNAYKAFRKHIDTKNSVHGDTYTIMEQKLTSKEPAMKFTLEPEAVLKKVIHALESKHPKIRYHVTIHTHVAGILKRILPDAIMDTVIKKG